jgi:hypothetical protein
MFLTNIAEINKAYILLPFLLFSQVLLFSRQLNKSERTGQAMSTFPNLLFCTVVFWGSHLYREAEVTQNPFCSPHLPSSEFEPFSIAQ